MTNCEGSRRASVREIVRKLRERNEHPEPLKSVSGLKSPAIQQVGKSVEAPEIGQINIVLLDLQTQR